MEQDSYYKEAENIAETLIPFQSSEMENMNAENLIESSSKSQLPEKNKEETENCAKASSDGQTSKKRTREPLRAKSKALKKHAASNSLKAKKAKGTLEGKDKRKSKNALKGKKENIKNEYEHGKNQNSMQENIPKNFPDEEHIEKDQEIEQNQKNSKGSRDQKNKGKLEKVQRNEKKKENLGGLIFLCSAKTKPDCFRYHVMGVTTNKKDLVLKLKPGQKLFLYDFDLKLMYGIYQASSYGGLKLEPKAFGGAFPVQVRFSIYKDCFPISERVFKKAIKDNYNDKNRFDTQLTYQQVRRLSELFQPAVFQSVPARSPPMANIRDKEARESRVYSDREGFASGNYDGRSYPMRSHERDQRIEYREVGSIHRKDIRCDLFMSERDYRTYGLKGERRKLSPPHGASREAVHVDPLYLPRREFQSYNPTVRQELPPVSPFMATTTSNSATTALDPYKRDPYYTYLSGSSVGAHLPPPRREEISSVSYYRDGAGEAYSVERKTDQMDGLYSKYAADALSRYNRGPLSEAALPTVSSKYSFVSPSVSYRLR